MYSKKIMSLFRNPKHAGKLKNPDGVGEVLNPQCGDSMRVFIKIDKNEIKKIRVQTVGCVAAISSSEALACLVEGKTLDKALKISKEDIIKFLGGDVPAPKIHCSLLAMEALKKAVEDYKKKNKSFI